MTRRTDRRRPATAGDGAVLHDGDTGPTGAGTAAADGGDGSGDAERGAATAEYAIATMAAVAFAGLLVVILQSDEVRQILTDLVRQALTYTG